MDQASHLDHTQLCTGTVGTGLEHGNWGYMPYTLTVDGATPLQVSSTGSVAGLQINLLIAEFIIYRLSIRKK